MLGRRSLSLLLLLQLMPTSAPACLCISTDSLSDRFDRYNHVLFVQITSAEMVDFNAAPMLGQVTATFRVLENFKSIGPPVQILRSEIGSCGFGPLAVGGSYIVFTDDGNLHGCGSSEMVFPPQHPKLEAYLEELSAMAGK